MEIVTSSVDELFPLIDPFLENVLTYGREVYSMPEKNLKISAAHHYLSLAQEFYDSANDSIQREHYRLGLDGAYNAAELVVKGFLILKISDLHGSQGGSLNALVNFILNRDQLRERLDVGQINAWN